MLKLSLPFLFILFTWVSSEKFRFDNYTLYKVLPKNENHIKLLQELEQNDAKLDFWSGPAPSAEYVSIMASPEQKNKLEGFLNLNGIGYDIAMKNVQE